MLVPLCAIPCCVCCACLNATCVLSCCVHALCLKPAFLSLYIETLPPCLSWTPPFFPSPFPQFLIKDPEARLGCNATGEADIKGHPFFASIDFTKLEKKGIKPPFKPPVVR